MPRKKAAVCVDTASEHSDQEATDAAELAKSEESEEGEDAPAEPAAKRGRADPAASSGTAYKPPIRRNSSTVLAIPLRRGSEPGRKVVSMEALTRLTGTALYAHSAIIQISQKPVGNLCRPTCRFCDAYIRGWRFLPAPANGDPRNQKFICDGLSLSLCCPL